MPAGAWVDRMHHRRVLIVADLVKAVLYASVPLAWWLGGLSLGQLYAVALLTGGATVFFDVGAQSVLPGLVGREHLVDANAAVVGPMAFGNVAGRGAGGMLVQLLTAPLAIAVTALGHLGSALRLTALRRTPIPATTVGPTPTPPASAHRSPRACGTSSALRNCAHWPSPPPSTTSDRSWSTPSSRSCSCGN
ncbi:MFS transporter [Kitasatospora sp. NPDC017646]|uniref:MFS transporter n=1 Tax=Kitasatospora sp. NPDC017646 TaxID=3364024 RepID=UPI0037A4F05E